MQYNYSDTYEKIDHHKVQIYRDKMNNGDLKAKEKVINHYANQVKRIIDIKFNNTKYNKDDLFKAGLIGLLEALKRNNTKSCTLLSRLIYYYVETEINRFIISQNKAEINITPKDVKTPVESVEEKETFNEILTIINKLPEQDKNIIYLYFYKNKFINQIAELYNLSKQAIHSKLKENIIYIKEQLYLKNVNLNNNLFALNKFKNLLNLEINKDIIKILEEDNNFNLHTIINELPNKKRNIIYLYLYGDYSIKEISDIYILPENDVQRIIDKIIIYIKQTIFFNKKNNMYNEIALLNIKKLLNKGNNKKIIEFVSNNSNLIFKAIKKFQHHKRNILYLYFFENYSINQIAEMYDYANDYIKEIINEGFIFIKQYIIYKRDKYQRKEKRLQKKKTL